MYKVIDIDMNGCYSERTLFRSHVASDCWNFIRARLSNRSSAVREQARWFLVKNSMDEFIDAPCEIKAIQNHLKLSA